jgi:hypothetical protein
MGVRRCYQISSLITGASGPLLLVAWDHGRAGDRCCACDAGRDLLQDFHLLGHDGVLGQRTIPLRSCEAGHEAPSKWIADANEHDRNCPGLLLHDRYDPAARDEDHIGLEPDEFRSVGLNPREVVSSPTFLDPQVLALRPTELPQLITRGS